MNAGIHAQDLGFAEGMFWRRRWSDQTRVALRRPAGLAQFPAHQLFLFAGAWSAKGALFGEISLASPSGSGLHDRDEFLHDL